MNDIKNSQLLEDACMSKLKWSIQRVANASKVEMQEALQIFNTMSKSTNSDEPSTKTLSRQQSRRQSQATSPISTIKSPPPLSVNVILPTLGTIEHSKKRLGRQRKRINTMKTIIDSQQTTDKDQAFLENELFKEEALLTRLQENIQSTILKDIKSKRILLTMYENISETNDVNDEWSQRDRHIIDELMISLKNMEHTYELFSD